MRAYEKMGPVLQLNFYCIDRSQKYKTSDVSRIQRTAEGQIGSTGMVLIDVRLKVMEREQRGNTGALHMDRQASMPGPHIPRTRIVLYCADITKHELRGGKAHYKGFKATPSRVLERMSEAKYPVEKSN